MPRMDKAQNQDRLVKLLIVGNGKIGKSHYAGMAAKEGFNILYLDGDVGSATLTQLPIEVQRNIYLLSIGDTNRQGMRDTRFADTVREFTNLVKFRWNDTHGRLASRNDQDGEIWEIRPGNMGPDTILVLDSWTGYIESLMLKCAREINVDIQTANTAQMRPVYQMAGLRATAMLQMIRAAQCHVICIAHTDEYQHKVPPEGKKVSEVREADLEIAYIMMIPKSTSKPHGLQLPKYFTDVAWMELSPSGKERRLDFQPKPDRVGGGHFAGVKNVDEYSFANLVKQLGGTVPGKAAPIDSWLTITDAADQAPAPAQVLDGTKSTPITGIEPPKKGFGLFTNKETAPTAVKSDS
jgi:hypothetical protein